MNEGSTVSPNEGKTTLWQQYNISAAIYNVVCVGSSFTTHCHNINSFNSS